MSILQKEKLLFQQGYEKIKIRYFNPFRPVDPFRR